MLFERKNSRAAKMTAGQVQEMRMRYRSGLVTQAELSREYKLSLVQVGRIVNYQSWQNVSDTASQEEIDASLQRVIALAAQPPDAVDQLQQDIAALRAENGKGDRMLEELTDLPVTKMEVPDAVKEKMKGYLG